MSRSELRQHVALKSKDMPVFMRVHAPPNVLETLRAVERFERIYFEQSPRDKAVVIIEEVGRRWRLYWPHLHATHTRERVAAIKEVVRYATTGVV